MKKIIPLVALIASMGLNAQLLVDDFKTGNLSNIMFNSGENDPLFQNGNSIVGNRRKIHAKINQNPFDQNIQVSIKNGILAISAAYDTRGTVYMGYGQNKNGNTPLNLDVSSYKNLNIAFEAKGTVNGIYVSLFTGTSRGVFSSHVQARESDFVFKVPLSKIKKVGEKYTLKDIDHIRFQFDSRSKTGCNMAIKKIWFE